MKKVGQNRRTTRNDGLLDAYYSYEVFFHPRNSCSLFLRSRWHERFLLRTKDRPMVNAICVVSRLLCTRQRTIERWIVLHRQLSPVEKGIHEPLQVRTAASECRQAKWIVGSRKESFSAKVLNVIHHLWNTGGSEYKNLSYTNIVSMLKKVVHEFLK